MANSGSCSDAEGFACHGQRLLATVLAGLRTEPEEEEEEEKGAGPYEQDGKEMVMLTLKEWTNDPNTMNNPTLLLIAGIIFTCEVISCDFHNCLPPSGQKA